MKTKYYRMFCCPVLYMNCSLKFLETKQRPPPPEEATGSWTRTGTTREKVTRKKTKRKAKEKVIEGKQPSGLFCSYLQDFVRCSKDDNDASRIWIRRQQAPAEQPPDQR